MEPRKFPLPNSLQGSPPSLAEMEEFISNEWADDEIMYQVLRYGIEVVSVNRDGPTVEVTVVYSSNPSDLGDEQYTLFHLDDFGFFPTCMQRMRMTERYIWEDELSCDYLDNEKYHVENLDLDVEDFDWDDPGFPRVLFARSLEFFDAYSIGHSLVTGYGADKSLPEFVPLSLREYFAGCVRDYLLSEQ